jgi:hypothetical protein
MRNDRGQAAIETILLTFVLITFVAAAYQVYLVNQTIFRSITAAHALLFSRAFERNCADHDSRCEYSQDPRAERLDGVAASVEWNPAELPEVKIPVVGMFRRYGLDDPEPTLASNRGDSFGGFAQCQGAPCKRSRLGAGTYKNVFDGVLFLGRIHWDTLGLMDGLGALGAALDALD